MLIAGSSGTRGPLVQNLKEKIISKGEGYVRSFEGVDYLQPEDQRVHA